MKNENFASAPLTSWDLATESALVECPGCRSCALVRTLGNARRLMCRNCGYNREMKIEGIATAKEGIEPFFNTPYWLNVNCEGENIWAVNERHLTFLEEILPKADRSEKSREAVLRGLSRLRELLYDAR